MKIRCKHLLTIPNERLQRWRNVLVVVRLFELVNGKRNREKEKRYVEIVEDFGFQMFVIYIMFKLIVQLACTTTSNFA